MREQIERNISKNLDMKYNVTIRVIDPVTRKIVNEHIGHNMATNSMLTGIAHYLTGDGVFNQAGDTLIRYVPQYISLGTMGLYSQDEDEEGLPLGIGESAEQGVVENYNYYMNTIPGYGADGFKAGDNNGRPYLGLGLPYKEHYETTLDPLPVNCELISTTFPRAKISFREIIPESEAEFKHTIDIVMSAMVSVGALTEFRKNANVDLDHIFITEAGLWSRPNYQNSNDNGLLAAYRIAPQDVARMDMTDEANRRYIQSQIIRVGVNQVVQVVWKLQIGGLYDRNYNNSSYDYSLYWQNMESETEHNTDVLWGNM